MTANVIVGHGCNGSCVRNTDPKLLVFCCPCWYNMYLPHVFARRIQMLLQRTLIIRILI